MRSLYVVAVSKPDNPDQETGVMVDTAEARDELRRFVEYVRTSDRFVVRHPQFDVRSTPDMLYVTLTDRRPERLLAVPVDARARIGQELAIETVYNLLGDAGQAAPTWAMSAVGPRKVVDVSAAVLGRRAPASRPAPAR